MGPEVVRTRYNVFGREFLGAVGNESDGNRCVWDKVGRTRLLGETFWVRWATSRMGIGACGISSMYFGGCTG